MVDARRYGNAVLFGVSVLEITLYATNADGDMNHKRKRPKQSRAGCLLCKPNKLGKGMEKKLGHRGFGKLRKEAAAQQDLSRAT